MNGTHKGHRINVSVSRMAGPPQWKPCLMIVWEDDGNGRVSKITLDRPFRDRKKAEMEGLMFAKKWIDDGKPDLSLDVANDMIKQPEETSRSAA